MPDPTTMLSNNRRWARAVASRDPEFFSRLAAQQRPDCLWIGCSDSRVPATQIVDVPPGEIFVHRNVANLVKDDDLNCQSAIKFAVDVLEVRHILVCGHHGCAGVATAITEQATHPQGPSSEPNLVDTWLQPLARLVEENQSLLDGIEPESGKARALSELSVINQVRNTARTDAVTLAWQRGQELSLHGWVYDVGDGLLKDLKVSANGSAHVDELIEQATARLAESYRA